MRLSDQQWAFGRDVNMLTNYLISRGVKYTIGKAWRRPSTQKWLYKKGWTDIEKGGDHFYKLGIDIFVWINGRFMRNNFSNKELVEPLGTYWKNLNPLNHWGGDWIIGKDHQPDLAHYGRKLMR